MTMPDASVSGFLNQVNALEERCNSRENLHTLCNEAEIILGLMDSYLSKLPHVEKHEQQVVIEQRLMRLTRHGEMPWRHVANFTLERFRLLTGNDK